ncbi:hypothetical protein ES708_05923 [subsurface metagenome]
MNEHKPFTVFLPCGSLCRGRRGSGEGASPDKETLSGWGESPPVADRGDRSMSASAPRCLTLETLWFKGDFLIPTIRFSQGEDGGPLRSKWAGFSASRA